jgi:uncharacterized membrane protein
VKKLTDGKIPDMSNKEQRKKTYEAYLRKSKPFWFWLNKIFFLFGVIGLVFTLTILLNHVYSDFLWLALLILVISFVGIMISHYKLDGSISKPWWEIY